MYYNFTHKELPFQLNTLLRFLCKSTVMRRQFDGDERVSYTPQTKVTMVVPTAGNGIDPYIIATCPVTGCNLRLTVKVVPERPLETRNDAVAYLRRTLCNEAIKVSERDIHNVEKYGERKHYTKRFFKDLIAKYQYRVDTFATYNFHACYD
ncbi:hypothetical protein D3C81_542770 [compost metagenome]